MNKICTSLEQSKKLIELGIDVNSADMYYSRADVALGEMESYPNILHCEEIGDDIPCWSLAALLKVLPIEVYIEIDNVCCTLDISRDTLGKWFVSYHNKSYGSSLVTCSSKELIDACHEMIVKLKEKKLL